MKKIKQILVTAVFITIIPLLAIELMIKRQEHFFTRVKVNFQLMLFVVDLGNQKQSNHP